MPTNDGNGNNQRSSLIGTLRSIRLDPNWLQFAVDEPFEALSIYGKKEEKVRSPWIEVDKFSFTSDEEWEWFCRFADVDPKETEKLRIYINKVDAVD